MPRIMCASSTTAAWLTLLYIFTLKISHVPSTLAPNPSVLWTEDFNSINSQFSTVAVPGALSQCSTRMHRKEFNGNDMEVVVKKLRTVHGNSTDKVLKAILSRDGSARVDQHKKYRSEFIMSNGKGLTDALGRDGCIKNCCDYLQFNTDYTLNFETMFESWDVDLPYPSTSRRSDDMDTSVMQLHGIPEGRFVLKRDGSIQTNYGTPDEMWRSPPFMLSLSTMQVAGSFVPSWAIRSAYTNQSTAWISARHTIGRTHWWDGIWPKWNISAVPDVGRWVSWELELRLSYGSDGVYNMYKDGNLVYSQTGPNCYYDRVAPRVHVGLYKWAWPPQTTSVRGAASNRTVAADDKIMFYDNIRLADGFTHLRGRARAVVTAAAVRPRLAGPALWGDGQWRRAESRAQYPSFAVAGHQDTCSYVRDAHGICDKHDWHDVFVPAHTGDAWWRVEQITWATTQPCMTGKRWLFLGTGLARSQMASLACLLRTPTSVFHSNDTHASFHPSPTDDATVWFQELPPLPKASVATKDEMVRLLVKTWNVLPDVSRTDVIVVALDKLTALVRLSGGTAHAHRQHEADTEHIEHALSMAVHALCRYLAHLRATHHARVYITTPLPSWTREVERAAHQQLLTSTQRPMTWADLARSGDDAIFRFDETGSIRHWDQYIYYETLRAAAEARVPVINIYDAAKYQMMDRTHFFAPPTTARGYNTTVDGADDHVRMCLPGSVDTYNAMLVSSECAAVDGAESAQRVRRRREAVKPPPPPSQVPRPPAPSVNNTNIGVGVCDAYDWVFVFGTGRSGSSTVLQMLNAVPDILLSGENYGLYTMLHDSKRLVNNTNAWGTRPNPAWGEDPDFHGIQDDICSWLLHMAPTTPASDRATIRGFKEIRPQCLPPIVEDFPRAKFIVNYRRNLTEHAVSYQRMHPDLTLDKATLLLQEKLDKFRQALADVPRSRKMELPLEDFSTSAFNRVLNFLGVEHHRFQCVVHSNVHYADQHDELCTHPLQF